MQKLNNYNKKCKLFIIHKDQLLKIIFFQKEKDGIKKTWFDKINLLKNNDF